MFRKKKAMSFHEIKDQVLKGYSKRWNLKALNYSLKNNEINQKERDKLIALIYSRGKTDKLLKMRGHHITNRMIMGQMLMGKATEADYRKNELMKKVYSEKFIWDYNHYLFCIDKDSIIQVVEGSDDICYLDCPYFKYCDKNDSERFKAEMTKKINENRDIYPEEADKWAKGIQYLKSYNEIDNLCLDHVGSKNGSPKVGWIIRFGDLFFVDKVKLFKEDTLWEFI
ncbi:MAG: hypothetical protein ACQEP1_05220 [Nanobdellota archaeon]